MDRTVSLGIAVHRTARRGGPAMVASTESIHPFRGGLGRAALVLLVVVQVGALALTACSSAGNRAAPATTATAVGDPHCALSSAQAVVVLGPRAAPAGPPQVTGDPKPMSRCEYAANGATLQLSVYRGPARPRPVQTDPEQGAERARARPRCVLQLRPGDEADGHRLHLPEGLEHLRARAADPQRAGRRQRPPARQVGVRRHRRGGVVGHHDRPLTGHVRRWAALVRRRLRPFSVRWPPRIEREYV